jgi:hypothetical protein
MSTNGGWPAPVGPHFGRQEPPIPGMIAVTRGLAIGCIVKDLTPSGATLEVAHVSLVPSRFRLLVRARELDAQCEVVGRTETGINVRFARKF